MGRTPSLNGAAMLPRICMIVALCAMAVRAGECDNWQVSHPEWIFCDDFEDSGALVKAGRYFEHGDNGGDFVIVNDVGLDGSHGMRVRFQQGEVTAGHLALGFGRNPNAYMNKQGIRPTTDFREVYCRMYLKMQTGWQGSPAKLMRVTVFSSASDWSQAMIGHLWSDDAEHLLIDPASCVDNSGNVACVGYNDFNHLKWLGMKSGTTPVFATDHSGIWYCVELHVKLNDPGQSNGVEEFWIDGNLEARDENLNFTGTYTAYAINAAMFENYWNAGSTRLQERYFDNIVVSTVPIGPVAGTAAQGRSRSPRVQSTAPSRCRIVTPDNERTPVSGQYLDIRGRAPAERAKGVFIWLRPVSESQ